MGPTELTYEQKLEALSLKYYQGIKWIPKDGDFYTTSRNDLELYQIVSVQDGIIKTKYCDPDQDSANAEWPESEFLKDFGEHRVHVPNFILQ